MLPVSIIASDVLGTVVSDGEFRVNGSTVSGSATLFNNSAVETTGIPTRLEFKGGWMLLASNSLARVNSSRIVLERGIGELGATPGLELEARSLRIVPAGSGAAARVKLDGADKVLVGAVRGPVRVLNSAGTLVASLNPGTTLSFLPNAAAADTFDVTGCLLWKEGRFIAVDANGQKITLVSRPDLADLSGNPVHLIGTGTGTMIGGLPEVTVSGITRVGDGGCAAVAESEKAQLQPPYSGNTPVDRGQPAKVSKPHGSHTAIYAGVGVAAAAAVGIALGLSKKGTSD